MHKKYDLVATVGEYESDGQTKKRFLNVGSVFTGSNEDGSSRVAVKIDCLPISKDWDGWLSCYTPKDKA